MNLQLRHLIEAFKLVSAAVAGITLLGSIYIGIVKFSGGRVIPWLTPDETSALITTTINAARLEFSSRLDRLDNRAYKAQCDDYRDRLARAKMAIARNAHDLVANDLQYASLQMIATIPNCLPL